MPKRSNFGRKASRNKKQTRLTFEDAEQPAGSSSPASQLPPAKVRYQLRNGTEVTPSSSKETKKVASAEIVSPDPLNDSDEGVIYVRRQRLGGATPRSTKKELSDPDDVVFLRKQNLTRHDTESENDDIQGKPQGMFGSSSRPTQGGEDDSDEDESNSDSNSEPIITSSAIRKPAANMVDESEDSDDQVVARKRLRKPISDEEESDESDVRPSPAKRRHFQSAPKQIAPKKTSSVGGEGSASESPAHLTRKHTTRKRPRTDKEKALELLKRKKSGDMRAELTESESSSNQESESEDQLQHLSDFEDESEEEVVETPKPSPSKHMSRTPNTTKSKSSKEDEYEEDFIVDDDDDTLGVPTQSIPLEFTAHYNKPEKEHFKDAVEFYVHKELNPTYSEKNDVFERAFQKLDDKPSTLRRSEYGSSQWTAEFDTALDARPEYIEHGIPGADMGEGRCQACGRSKHTPTWSISFRGRAYDRNSLDEIEQTHEQHDDSQDDAVSDSGNSVDGLGRRLAPEDREFLAGRFCRAKAKKAHMLSHWRYHLYEWVRDELTNEPELSAKRMLARRKLKPWEKRDEVEGIIERWSHNGKIKGLYRDYKESVSKLEALQDNRWG